MKKVVLEKTEEPGPARRMSGSSNRMAGIVLMSSILVALSIPNLAHAAVFKCPSADVVCLIDAINAANSNGEKDTIKLSSGTYQLTEVDNDIDGQNGLPSITSEITIKGVRVDATTISGAGIFDDARIFHVATEGILKLVGLTVRDGSGGRGDGGCIYNAGTLTIRNSAIANCFLIAGGGGGIFNNGGKLSIRTSHIFNNFAEFEGGGILNVCGQVIVKNSTVVDNDSEFVGGGISSGSLFGESENCDLLLFIRNTTIDGNRAGLVFGGAGGIFAAGEATIINSTISNNLSFEGVGGGAIAKIGGTLTIKGSDIYANETEGPGGGILNIGGTATIKNTSITHNIARVSAFDMDGVGGGIFNSAGEMIIKNTAIFSNTAETEGGGIFNDVNSIVKLRNPQLTGNTAPVGPDCSGEILLLGDSNVIGDTSDCTAVSP